MTYRELYESAINKLEKSKITLGEFEKMIEPLNAEIATADSDTISRAKAIETVMECYDNDELFEVYEDKLRELPSAQPAPDQNGDLWITVPDIDEVTCIYVQESKSKFCRIFYEEQPERIKGRWIHHPEIGWGETWLCNQCGEKTTSTVIGKPRANFCPNCGADMREVTT